MPHNAIRAAATQQQVNRAVLGLVTIGFIALLASVGAALWFQINNQRGIEWVEHSRRVETLIAEFSALNEQVEAIRRGYLLTRQTAYRQRFDELAPAVPRALEALNVETADNARQQRRVALLREAVERHQDYQKRSVGLAFEGRRPEALSEFASRTGAEELVRARAITRAMSAEEARLLAQRDMAQRTSLNIFYGVLAIAGLLLVLVAAATLFVMLRYTRDLSRSQAALRSLNENLEEAVQERTVDLQRANDEIQRFAYIVSHDLRSPLVNVMGFTSELDAARKPITSFLETVEAERPDLVTADARMAVQEDLAESIGFIRTSTQKMDRLINAILRLSREGRRNLAPERLDMDALVGAVIDTLRHRIDEVGATVEIAGTLPALRTDRLAIEQIMSNLVENALKYLQPGRVGRIIVRGWQEGERAIFEVEDNGRGIDPRDHDRIFDLFRRSGAQDQPGEGIGLAHVRALAYRLGGLIDVRSELDRGATFRLSLPANSGGGEGA